MAKGQKRSNREIKKPKKDKAKAIDTAASQVGRAFDRGTAGAKKK